jgi:hypothetical protein
MFLSCSDCSMMIFPMQANISPTPRRSIPALPACRAEGLRPHTLGGLGSCLFRRRPAATPKRRRQLSDARGHLPPWPPTRRAARSASLCRAIPNAAARPRARSAPQAEPPGAPLAHRALRRRAGAQARNTGGSHRSIESHGDQRVLKLVDGYVLPHCRRCVRLTRRTRAKCCSIRQFVD